MKTRVFIVAILVLSMLLTLGACVDKESDEYKYDVARFYGEYETYGYTIFIGIHYYNPEGVNDPKGFSTNIFSPLTEDWLYYNGEYDELGQPISYMIKLDANLVKAVNETIVMISKVEIDKKEMRFPNSSIGFEYDRDLSGFTDLDFKRTLFNFQDQATNPYSIQVEAFYNLDYKKIRMRISSEATATDGKTYTYLLEVMLQNSES